MTTWKEAVKTPHEPIIYHLRQDDDVYIGTTTALVGRLGTHKTHARKPLLLVHIEPGSYSKETQVHGRNCDLLVNGSYYYYTHRIKINMAASRKRHVAFLRSFFQRLGPALQKCQRIDMISLQLQQYIPTAFRG